MNAGIPTNATQNPCHAPTTAPTPSARTTAAHQGKPHCIIEIAEIAPTIATTEPTERSMCPAIITTTMPTARMSTYAFCWMRLLMLPGSRRRPLVRIWNRITITARAARIPY
jgi:hypothetical protein